MRNNFLMMVLAISTLSISCQKAVIKSSGDITTEARVVENFNQMEVSGAMEVDVTYSTTEERVFVEANSNLHPYVVVESVAGILRIRMKDNINLRMRKGDKLKVHVFSSAIEKIELSGASDVRLKNEWEADRFDLQVSGASTLSGPLNVMAASIDMSGASEVNVEGNIIEGKMDLSGASTWKGYNMAIDNLDIYLSGAGAATLTANKTINITASGSSTLNYKGNAVIGKSEITGASNVVKKD